MLRFSFLHKFRSIGHLATRFFGQATENVSPGRFARAGLVMSGLFMLLSGLWAFFSETPLIVALWLSPGLLVLGGYGIFLAVKNKLSLRRINQFSFVGYFIAAVSLYILFSRFSIVSYTTDTVVATYMGVLKALQLQSPYGVSIKALLDQAGFTQSFYTPRVNGSFDFHLAYPSVSFLSVIPFYAVGLHDLRDSIFIFYLMSIVLIFAVSPAKFKSISLAPFGLFPFVIAGSWTDSIWAFFLVLTAIFWYSHPKASWASFGLAVATKQIAIVVAPFLFIRFWHETAQQRSRKITTYSAIAAAAFFLPNIPFILASPGAWWGDIVGPYLPSSMSQVPGGVGLSNFLLDLGFALPSEFYLVLMVGALSFLAYFYSKHYKGLNSMVFAFPIFLFFFYYRSFPNYMAYWLFPMVLEICRLGGPNLQRLFTLRLPTFQWTPPTGTLLKVFRRRLTPSAMILVSLTLIFAGASGAYISQASNPKTTIRITAVADPDSIGAATGINLTLTNLLSTPINPTFFVKWQPLPYIWLSNSTIQLNAGQTRSYALASPDALSAIPRGDQFHIMVYDGLTGQLLGESPLGRADIATPSLANPGLKWWALQESAGKKVPFGWKLSWTNTDLLSSRISPLGVNGTSGVEMVLNDTSTTGAVATLSLSQRITLAAASTSIYLNQSFATNLPSKTILAASVTDGIHTLYYLFSSQAQQQTIKSYPTNTTVIVPTALNQWNTATLTPNTIWVGQGWTTPQLVTFTLFAQSETPGVYYASLSSVTPA